LITAEHHAKPHSPLRSGGECRSLAICYVSF